MTKLELIAFIDEKLSLFQKAHQAEPEDAKADFISDYYIFDMEFEIAKFAVAQQHQATINGLTIHQLVTEEDLEDENGFDVNVSELISNWISTTSKSIVYNSVRQDIPNDEILEVIRYYEDKLLSL
jgi:hypothetical protein